MGKSKVSGKEQSEKKGDDEKMGEITEFFEMVQNLCVI